jgi:hypothetical protein
MEQTSLNRGWNNFKMETSHTDSTGTRRLSRLFAHLLAIVALAASTFMDFTFAQAAEQPAPAPADWWREVLKHSSHWVNQNIIQITGTLSVSSRMRPRRVQQPTTSLKHPDHHTHIVRKIRVASAAVGIERWKFRDTSKRLR